MGEELSENLLGRPISVSFWQEGGPMRMLLSLKTGDVTKEARTICECQVEADRPAGKVRFSLAEGESELSLAEWPLLIEQLKTTNLVKHHWPDSLQPPLQTILKVVQQIRSTPTYQLFLAGIDIAERIDLISEGSPEIVQRRFKTLDNWVSSVTGAGGLFFVPESVSSHFAPEATNELLQNNKLCTAEFTDLKRFYVPYATPIGFILPVSRDAENVWDEVRTLYYAYRHPA
jgi:hypothetical protein